MNKAEIEKAPLLTPERHAMRETMFELAIQAGGETPAAAETRQKLIGQLQLIHPDANAEEIVNFAENLIAKPVVELEKGIQYHRTMAALKLP